MPDFNQSSPGKSRPDATLKAFPKIIEWDFNETKGKIRGCQGYCENRNKHQESLYRKRVRKQERRHQPRNNDNNQEMNEIYSKGNISKPNQPAHRKKSGHMVLCRKAINDDSSKNGFNKTE